MHLKVLQRRIERNLLVSVFYWIDINRIQRPRSSNLWMRVAAEETRRSILHKYCDVKIWTRSRRSRGWKTWRSFGLEVERDFDLHRCQLKTEKSIYVRNRNLLTNRIAKRARRQLALSRLASTVVRDDVAAFPTHLKSIVFAFSSGPQRYS